MELRLETLQDGGNCISDEEQARIEKEFTEMRLQWRLRKKMFKNAWDAITENYAGKPRDLMVLLQTHSRIALVLSGTKRQRSISTMMLPYSFVAYICLINHIFA